MAATNMESSAGKPPGIELPASLSFELLHMSRQLGEPWEEVLGEALSELRTLRNVALPDSRELGLVRLEESAATT
ncbi:MAG: hypothetical protein AAGB00_02175 [Planctomycetota bacterium]